MNPKALLHRVAFATLAMGPFLTSSTKAQDLAVQPQPEKRTVLLSPHYRTDYMLELPVVLFSERHDNPTQDGMSLQEMECEVVRQLAGEGYGTLLLEFPPELEAPLQQFLKSGSYDDAVRFCADFARLQVENFKDENDLKLNQLLQALSPTEREARYELAGEEELQHGELSPILKVALAAKESGMEVHLIDCDAKRFASLKEATNATGSEIRNEVMAERVAFYARSSKDGVLLIGGERHEFSCLDGYVGIPQKLKELKVRNVVSIVPKMCLNDQEIALEAPAFDAVIDTPDQALRKVKEQEYMQMLSNSVVRIGALRDFANGSTDVHFHFMRHPAHYVPRERASIAQK